MQKRNVQILLIISLAFNLSFIGLGTFRYFQMKRHADPRLIFRHAPQEIKDKFKQYRQIIDPVKDEIEIARGEFIIELKKPDFDQEKLQEKLEEYLAKQAKLERIMGNNFIEIRKNLTPEQTEEFFSRFPKMKSPHPIRDKYSNLPRREHDKN